MKAWKDPWFRRATWTTIGLIGWVGLVSIGAMLASLEPPRAGDDLRVLVDAARRLLDGAPLYSTSAPSGSLVAESLFYSYPPPVAQALVPVAGLPLELLLVLWGAGATAGVGLIARLAGRRGDSLVLPTLALAPYTVPFAVALFFGNLDAWFPLAFGLVLVGVLARAPRATIAGGMALGAVSMAKLHPVTLGLWLVVRGAHLRRRAPEVHLAAVALLAGLGIVAASLLVGGTAPWIDYVAFLRSGAATADLIARLNIGPASQLALLMGLDNAAARSIHVAVVLGALGATLAAGWKVRDPVVSFGLAATASLVVLPVTWVHYPIALIPVAIASAARATGPGRAQMGGLLAAAIVVAAVALVAPPLMWVAVALVLTAAHVSRPVSDGSPVVSPPGTSVGAG